MIEKIIDKRRLFQVVEVLKQHKLPLLFGLFGMAVLTAVLSSHGDNDAHVIFKSTGPIDFKNASILGDPNRGVLKGEERLFARSWHFDRSRDGTFDRSE